LITAFEKDGYVLDSLAGDNKVPDACSVDGKHYSDISAEIDSDIATHRSDANAHHEKFTASDHDSHIHPKEVITPHISGLDSEGKLVLTAVGTPGLTDEVLSNHDKSLHDALGIDADTVDSKHYSDISAEIDSDIATHKSDANAHHEAFTPADHDARDHRGLRVLQSGTLANRPAAGEAGRIYYATDEERYYLDVGTDWLTVAAPKLARLIEKDHSSLDNIGPDDHHPRTRPFHSDTSLPSTGVDGEFFYNTQQNRMYRYDASSSQWIPLDYLSMLSRIEDGLFTDAGRAKFTAGFVNETLLSGGAVTLPKLAGGVAGQASEELSTVVETTWLADINDLNAGLYTNQTTYSDDGSQKEWSWSYSASGAQAETTYIRVRFKIRQKLTEVPTDPIMRIAFVRVLEDGAVIDEVNESFNWEPFNAVGDTQTSVEKVVSWASTKESATIKLQIKQNSSSNVESCIERLGGGEGIRVEHKHRYKKYGVVKP